ncbi:APC family permease [Clostridium magnum]|uniref:Putative amino acid permease YhdG n=1 Tax=Clostridium magnum DSM 2767 TaxID=1121326 RepID=A0A161WV48_9CLOT|nr:amino acid permease [Clostridium magnum]KZL90748.1 putative amino acid permease YhdG [Clostridium magnum DSM 2767]SHJ34434.1 amino acid/polyamine/organocation transporter, APC superfamily (TC 2.A.3) [Clostridium magnum DSM 2767]
MNVFRKRGLSDFKESEEGNGLRKQLTAFDIALLGIGSVIGTGIFVATGQGSQLAGPAVTISYIIAAITSVLCALTYAELATMFPVAGSTYSYTYVAFGEIIAWLIGWNLILEYTVVSAAIASGWSSTLVGIFDAYNIHLPEMLVKSPLSGGIIDLPAVLVVAFLTWLLYIGVSESAKVNNIIVIIKVSVILVFIFIGATHINPVNYHPFAPYGTKGIMSAAAIIFFAYIGFDAVSTAAEETKNPKRDIPIGLGICMVVIAILYVAVSLTLTGMVPFKDIDVNNALPASLARIGINWGSTLVGVGAVVGMISSLLVTIYGQVRIFMVMARDGLIPKSFADISKKRGTPAKCTIATGALTAVIGGFLPLTVLMDLCNIGTLSAFIVVSIGVIVLRKTMPDVERKFKCPGVPFTPILTIFFCFYLMYSLPGVTWIRFAIWTIVGILIYFLYGMSHSALNKENNLKLDEKLQNKA